MAVSLPWVLLLLDWFYQRRWNKAVVLDKLPFVFLIIPIAFITFFKLSPHPNIAHNSILIGVWTFSWYLEKFILPINLLPAYSPVLPVTISNVIYLQSLAVFFVFIGSIFLCRKNRLFVFACLFWIATIFFFWRMDFADNNIVADRFMYLPSLGFCLLLGKYLSRFKLIAVLMVIVLGILTFNQCFMWRDDLTLWTTVLTHEPRNELAKKGQMAVIYGPRRKIPDFKKLTEAIDKNPSNVQSYLARGEALLADGDEFLAFSDFDKAVKIDSSNFMAYDMRGQLYSTRGEFKKALDDFYKSASLKADNPLAYFQIAAILEIMRDKNQALIWLDRALKINPSMIGVHYQRGLLFSDLREYPQAIDEFTRSISLKNDLANSYYKRGAAFVALKQFDQAQTDFKSSLKEDPYDIKVLNELGINYLRQKNDEKARDVFNKIISMYPYYDDAYNNRGIVDLQEKQYDMALKDYTDAVNLELYPYHALITRGDIYVAMGERKKALEDYNLAVLFSRGDLTAQSRRDHLIKLGKS